MGVSKPGGPVGPVQPTTVSDGEVSVFAEDGGVPVDQAPSGLPAERDVIEKRRSVSGTMSHLPAGMEGALGLRASARSAMSRRSGKLSVATSDVSPATARVLNTDHSEEFLREVGAWTASLADAAK